MASSILEGEKMLKRLLIITITGAMLLPSVVNAEPDNQDVKKLTERLNRLEPKIPVDLPDPPFIQHAFPSKIVPPQTIIQSEKQLPYLMLLDKLDWKRPSYKSYWHSSVSGGRWAYVPNRIHYAEHRLFTLPTAPASAHFDFVHNMGVDELFKVPKDTKGISEERRRNDIMVVVMQARIEKVLTSGNQVVIVARPQRTGVQTIKVNQLDMYRDNPKEAVLYQLVTPDGDEIDYSVL